MSVKYDRLSITTYIPYAWSDSREVWEACFACIMIGKVVTSKMTILRERNYRLVSLRVDETVRGLKETLRIAL